MTELEVIQEYVKANHEYIMGPPLEDPLDFVKITQYDQQAVSMVPEEAAYYSLVQAGDWFIREEKASYLVRVVGDEVEELWTNA